MQGQYKKSGVDIEGASKLKEKIGAIITTTHSSLVRSSVGGFCSLIDLREIIPDYNGPLIAQSTDGVGTKIRLAQMGGARTLRVCGESLVNHCINDILCSGAYPVSFLDYIAQDALRPEEVLALLEGMAQACRQACLTGRQAHIPATEPERFFLPAIVGGETAQMPGVYSKGETDIAGFITGVVAREDVIDGSAIEAGDCLVGLASNGLHTNGYSLVNKLFRERNWHPKFYFKELGSTLSKALLVPHRSYLDPVMMLRDSDIRIKGIAHITGGGIAENLVRILPKGAVAHIRKESWEAPQVFGFIQKHAEISEDEMFKIFNMGIGMIVAVGKGERDATMGFLEGISCKAYEVGEIRRDGAPEAVLE